MGESCSASGRNTDQDVARVNETAVGIGMEEKSKQG